MPPDDDVNLPVAAGMARDLHAAAVAAAPPPPPKEPPSALLDAILAMILMRVPPRPGADDEAHVRWLQQKHVAFVQTGATARVCRGARTPSTRARCFFCGERASGGPDSCGLVLAIIAAMASCSPVVVLRLQCSPAPVLMRLS